jgi:hypothetical protein
MDAMTLRILSLISICEEQLIFNDLEKSNPARQVETTWQWAGSRVSRQEGMVLMATPTPTTASRSSFPRLWPIQSQSHPS